MFCQNILQAFLLLCETTSAAARVSQKACCSAVMIMDRSAFGLRWLMAPAVEEPSQYLWAISATAQSRSRWWSISLCSGGVTCVSFCALCLLSHHWKKPGFMLFASSCQVCVHLDDIPLESSLSKLNSPESLSMSSFCGVLSASVYEPALQQGHIADVCFSGWTSSRTLRAFSAQISAAEMLPRVLAGCVESLPAGLVKSLQVAGQFGVYLGVLKHHKRMPFRGLWARVRLLMGCLREGPVMGEWDESHWIREKAVGFVITLFSLPSCLRGLRVVPSREEIGLLSPSKQSHSRDQCSSLAEAQGVQRCWRVWKHIVSWRQLDQCPFCEIKSFWPPLVPALSY